MIEECESSESFVSVSEAGIDGSEREDKEKFELASVRSGDEVSHVSVSDLNVSGVSDAEPEEEVKDSIVTEPEADDNLPYETGAEGDVANESGADDLITSAPNPSDTVIIDPVAFSTVTSINDPSDTSVLTASDAYYYDEDKSWTESIETFINQLDDLNYSHDHESEAFEFLNDDDDEMEEEVVVRRLRKGQKFLVYLAVPVLISHLLMLILLSSGGDAAARDVKPGQLIVIHQNHHHHTHCHYYIFESGDESTMSKFFYVLFSPFEALSNTRCFKQSTEWIHAEYKKHCSNPDSLLARFNRLLMKVNAYMLNGIESEIGNVLRVRDQWNRIIYDKIYKMAESPRYQRVVSNVSKWASSLKKHFFS